MRPSNVPTPFGRIFPPNKEWLGKAEPEAILEPDVPIVDTHHHFWDLRKTTGDRYLLDEFLADTTTGHNIVATVYMNCYDWDKATGPVAMRPVTETEVVAGIAAMCDTGIYGDTRVAAGIVGFADLRLGDAVVPVLQAHIRAGGGRFRGIRHSGGWDADPIIGNSFPDMVPELYRRPEFRAGFAHLSELGLVFDAWVYHPQLPDLVDLAQTFPETTIVVGHCGAPLGYGPYAGKRDEVFNAWKGSMAELAKCPNVFVKLGGMMMRLGAYDYDVVPRPPTSSELATIWAPYIETCIDLFGPDRGVFESNFPADKQWIGYATVWNTHKRIIAGASPDQKEALFSGNARRIYQLG